MLKHITLCKDSFSVIFFSIFDSTHRTFSHWLYTLVVKHAVYTTRSKPMATHSCQSSMQMSSQSASQSLSWLQLLMLLWQSKALFPG